MSGNQFTSALNLNFTDPVYYHSALSKEFYSHCGVNGWLERKPSKRGSFSVEFQCNCNKRHRILNVTSRGIRDGFNAFLEVSEILAVWHQQALDFPVGLLEAHNPHPPWGNRSLPKSARLLLLRSEAVGPSQKSFHQFAHHALIFHQDSAPAPAAAAPSLTDLKGVSQGCSVLRSVGRIKHRCLHGRRSPSGPPKRGRKKCLLLITVN